MMRHYKLVTLVTIIASVFLLPLSGCSGAVKSSTTPALALNVIYPSDNAALATNLANVSGTVSMPDAAVTVQGHDAYVDAQGNFIGYALLDEGTNTVQVTASEGGQSQTQTLDLSFTKPLAVFLDGPIYGENYDHTPIVATGYVNYPQASVEVNGVPATVTPDGSFSANVVVSVGDTLTAVATLGDQSDSMGWGVFLYPPPMPIPVLYELFDSIIDITAGESYAGQTSADAGKLVRTPSALSHTIEPVSLVNGNFVPADWPTGLEITFQPDIFIFYPNAAYTSHIIVRSTSQTPLGEYYFQINTTLDDVASDDPTLKVEVLPKSGGITRTINVNSTSTSDGTSLTLQRVDFTNNSVIVTAFNTPSGYALPNGPYLAPSDLMHPGPDAYYSFGGSDTSVDTPGVRFLPTGMQYTWIIDSVIPRNSKTLKFTVSSMVYPNPPWIFNVPLG